jgi:hypothetical protein
MWGRLGGAAALALVLAAGGAVAGEMDGVEDEGVPISGEGVEGEVTVTGGVVDEPGLPPGFCDDCEETGTIVSEVLAVSSHGSELRPHGGEGAEFGVMHFAQPTSGADLCASPQHYVAWMCEWQGYPQP